MNAKLTVTFNGKPRFLNMSFGLLSELVRIVNPGDDMAATILSDDVHQRVLRSVLSHRTTEGVIETEYKPFVDEISLEDIGAILDWVLENIVDFFIQRQQNLIKVVKDRKAENLKL